MANKTNWLWALRDKDKAMKTMGLSPVKKEQATPLPTVRNNQKASMQSTVAIIKEPKREKLTWSDEDSRDGWNDRLFLEGFYEVDGTVNDWEREKRMSQVERSLKEIEKRKQKTQKPPLPKGRGTAAWRWRDFEPNPNAVRAPFSRNLTGQSGTFTGLPGNPNAPAQITKLPYYGGRYPAYTNYANAANENTVASKSGDTTRPPTKEEMQAAYADMQKGFSGQNALQHINDAAEYVTNAATPQNNTQGKTQTATTTVTAQTQSRDARVRENYRARQQAEADARYEDFDIEAAEAKLRDNAYWTDRLLESRKQGYGFAGDEQIAEERNTLEEEIKRAKDAADRRRERYIREKAAQMPDNGLHELLRWSVRNMPERKQDTFSVSPQFSNTLYPEISPGYSNGSIPQKNYYTKNKSIYGENTDKAPDAISNILTATSLVPGIDTFADAAAIPVDLLRGDYISAGLDAFGILPFVGEVADTAKLARAGMNVADVAHDAGKVIDAVKMVDAADDVVDVVRCALLAFTGHKYFSLQKFSFMVKYN